MLPSTSLLRPRYFHAPIHPRSDKEPPSRPQIRFLFPVLPLWNVCAAVTLQRVYNNRSKSAAWRLVAAATSALLAGGAAVTALAAAASFANYPGGHGLRQLHAAGAARAAEAGRQGRNVTVHVGVLPAMTGVSRFGELGPPWQYSKVWG